MKCILCENEVKRGEYISRTKDPGMKVQGWAICFSCVDTLQEIKQRLTSKCPCGNELSTEYERNMKWCEECLSDPVSWE